MSDRSVDTETDVDEISADDESVAISPCAVTPIMKQCRLINQNSVLLSHSDQFISCAAGSVGEHAFAESSAIGSRTGYSGISYDASTRSTLRVCFARSGASVLYNL